jgi:hypothetical protein
LKEKKTEKEIERLRLKEIDWNKSRKRLTRRQQKKRLKKEKKKKTDGQRVEEI